MISLGTGLNPPFPRSVMAQIIQKALLQYGSTLITNPDGTRAIKNEGTATDSDAILYSGQGLEFTTNEYFKTGIGLVSNDTNHTIIATYVVPPSNNYRILGAKWGVQINASHNGATVRLGSSVGNIWLGFGSTRTGEVVTICVTRNTVTGKQYAYSSFGTYAESDAGSFNTWVADIAIGGWTETEGNGYTVVNQFTGVGKDIASFRDYWTQDKFNEYLADPEGLLFWEGNTAKSRHLEQPAIDALVAGDESFIYRLNEGVDAINGATGDYLAYNLAKELPTNLANNGDFSGGNTSWSAQSHWEIVDGKAICDSDGSSGNRDLGQQNTLIENEQYIVEFDVVDYVSGTLNLWVGSSVNTSVDSTGHYIVSFTLTRGDGNIAFYANTSSGFVGAIDNVVIYPSSEATFKTIQGMVDDTPRTNADQLPYGVQNVAFKDNLRELMPTGQLNWDGKSKAVTPYAVDGGAFTCYAVVDMSTDLDVDTRFGFDNAGDYMLVRRTSAGAYQSVVGNNGFKSAGVVPDGGFAIIAFSYSGSLSKYDVRFVNSSQDSGWWQSNNETEFQGSFGTSKLQLGTSHPSSDLYYMKDPAGVFIYDNKQSTTEEMDVKIEQLKTQYGIGV